MNYDPYLGRVTENSAAQKARRTAASDNHISDCHMLTPL